MSNIQSYYACMLFACWKLSKEIQEILLFRWQHTHFIVFLDSRGLRPCHQFFTSLKTSQKSKNNSPSPEFIECKTKNWCTDGSNAVQSADRSCTFLSEKYKPIFCRRLWLSPGLLSFCPPGAVVLVWPSLPSVLIKGGKQRKTLFDKLFSHLEICVWSQQTAKSEASS